MIIKITVNTLQNRSGPHLSDQPQVDLSSDTQIDAIRWAPLKTRGFDGQAVILAAQILDNILKYLINAAKKITGDELALRRAHLVSSGHDRVL